MGKNQAISKRLEQVDLQKAELAAINRLLVVSEGTFSLSIAVCNSPALRDHIVERIKNHSAGIKVIKIGKEVKDLFEFVKGKTDCEMPSGIFILDIEKAVPSDSKDPKVLRALNVTRELWKANYSCPIVFWVPEYVATLLCKHAPDLWSWVSHHFEFVSEQAGAISGKSDAYAGDISLAGSLDLDEKQFRIAELEQRIKDAGEPPKEDIAPYVVIWLNELGYIYYAIGELDKAEEMHNKALEIDKNLGRLEGMVVQYGNLGLIYITRGELDKAEGMLNKSLEIDKKLGRLEGMASEYGNLGLIYITRGDLDKAEEMLKKALEINENLGLQEGMAIQYSNLGVIYQTKGELDKAEEMHQKALMIAEKLGLQEIMANQYGNLGLIYKERGDTEKARQLWEKARDLYKKIGMPHNVKMMDEWIEGLRMSDDG